MSEIDPAELDQLRDGTIYVAGHRGMVGAAILRRLEAAGCGRLLLKTRQEADLTNQSAVDDLMRSARPDYVFLAAAKVGGIRANSTLPADFIAENLLIETNVIRAARRNDVQRLVFLGSSCIYPRLAPQPMSEDSLLTGALEPTNEPYAIAKIAGIKLCESYNRQHGTDFRSIMPTNLYGPNDNFDLDDSHVIPALIRKFHEAKSNAAGDVEVWGSGEARREFMHVDDLAGAAVFIMCLPRPKYQNSVEPMLSHLNVGTGVDLTIRELAELIKDVVGYSGAIRFDTSRPDGAPRKLLDVTKLNSLGWRAGIDLRTGIEKTYQWYLDSPIRAVR